MALAGLNPHAGENGLISDEEQKVFGPAVESCRARGVDVSDPIPGDAVFRRAAEGEFYAVSAGPSTSPWACRKARHDYHVFDTYEAGVVLLGTEVKAIREGRVNLKDSYGKVEAGEVVLPQPARQSPYSHRGYAEHEPLRRRKLLLNKREIPQADRQDRRARVHPRPDGGAGARGRLRRRAVDPCGTRHHRRVPSALGGGRGASRRDRQLRRVRRRRRGGGRRRPRAGMQ